MLILLLVVFMTLTIICAYRSEKYNDEFMENVVVLTGVCVFAAFIGVCFTSYHVITDCRIDKFIAMYQEENQAIEEHMDTLVKGYMDYESSTLEKFTPDSSITLVSLYPDLKSDELVQRQIDVYMANNQKIKEFKERQIYADVYRWWLYFGR